MNLCQQLNYKDCKERNAQEKPVKKLINENKAARAYYIFDEVNKAKRQEFTNQELIPSF